MKRLPSWDCVTVTKKTPHRGWNVIFGGGGLKGPCSDWVVSPRRHGLLVILSRKDNDHCFFPWKQKMGFYLIYNLPYLLVCNTLSSSFSRTCKYAEETKKCPLCCSIFYNYIVVAFDTFHFFYCRQAYLLCPGITFHSLKASSMVVQCYFFTRL